MKYIYQVGYIIQKSNYFQIGCLEKKKNNAHLDISMLQMSCLLSSGGLGYKNLSFTSVEKGDVNK